MHAQAKKASAAASADQRLSQLIQLKRQERPDPAFWHRFEQEFKSRQLTTFVQTQPLKVRLRRSAKLALRKAAKPIAAAAAVCLALFVASLFTSNSQPADSSAYAQQQRTDQPEAYFLVTPAEPAPSSSNPTASKTIYHVNTLSRAAKTTPSYQLKATPVTYTHGTSAQPHGAQVIRQQANY